jgi:hypothetical protein
MNKSHIPFNNQPSNCPYPKEEKEQNNILQTKKKKKNLSETNKSSNFVP